MNAIAKNMSIILTTVMLIVSIIAKRVGITMMTPTLMGWREEEDEHDDDGPGGEGLR